MAGVIESPVFPLGLPDPNLRIIGSGHTDSVTFGSGDVAARIALGGSALVDTPSFGSGDLVAGPVSLSGTGLSDPVTFGLGEVVSGVYTIIDDETDTFPPTFGSGSIAPGPVSLPGTGLVDGVDTGDGLLAPGPVQLVGYGIWPDTKFGIGSIRPTYIYFVGPKLTYGHGRRNSPLWWVEQRDGISLLKLSGVWTEVMYPTGDEIAAAEKAFRGGYRSPITGTEKNELIAAGYGSYIEEE